MVENPVSENIFRPVYRELTEEEKTRINVIKEKIRKNYRCADYQELLGWLSANIASNEQYEIFQKVNAAVDTWVSFTIEGAGASGTDLDLDFGDDVNLVIRGSSEDERIDVSYASNQYVDDITKRPYLLLTYAIATTTAI